MNLPGSRQKNGDRNMAAYLSAPIFLPAGSWRASKPKGRALGPSTTGCWPNETKRPKKLGTICLRSLLSAIGGSWRGRRRRHHAVVTASLRRRDGLGDLHRALFGLGGDVGQAGPGRLAQRIGRLDGIRFSGGGWETDFQDDLGSGHNLRGLNLEKTARVPRVRAAEAAPLALRSLPSETPSPAEVTLGVPSQ